MCDYPESDRAANGAEVMAAMREAGGSLISELYGVIDPDFLAERVYIAMAAIKSRQAER